MSERRPPFFRFPIFHGLSLSNQHHRASCARRFVVKVNTGRVGVNVENGEPSTTLDVAGNMRVTDHLRSETLTVVGHVTTLVMPAPPEFNLVLVMDPDRSVEIAPRGSGKLIIHGSPPTLRAANTTTADLFIEAGVDGDRSVVVRPNQQGALVVGGASPTVLSNGTLDVTAKNVEVAQGLLRLIPPHGQEVVISGEFPTLSSVTDKPLTLKTPSESRNLYLDPHHLGHVVVGGTAPLVRAVQGKSLRLQGSDAGAAESNVVMRPGWTGCWRSTRCRPRSRHRRATRCGWRRRPATQTY